MDAQSEPATVRWGRRALTFPAYALAFALLVATVPFLLPLAALVDTVRGARLATARLLLVATVYVACELAGLILAALLWARNVLRPDPAAFAEANFRLQSRWVMSILGAATWLFGLRFEVEGAETTREGPILLLMRHASVGDTLLPAALVSARHGLRLRYVLKRELLWDPCLDVVGRRLPNAFVRRGSGRAPARAKSNGGGTGLGRADRSAGRPAEVRATEPGAADAREVAAVRALAEGLGPRDGVLIFPEGTRFSDGARSRILARLDAEGPPERAAHAHRLRGLLPMRLGGVSALLDADPAADLVFCGHVGFDGVRRLPDLWNGVLVNRTIRVVFRRIPRREVPTEPEARQRWLADQWERMDAWVLATRGAV